MLSALLRLSHLISVTACERVREAGAEGAGGQEAAGWKLWWNIPSRPQQRAPRLLTLWRLLEVRYEGRELFPRFSAHLPALCPPPLRNELLPGLLFPLAVLSTGLGIPQVLGPSLFLSRDLLADSGAISCIGSVWSLLCKASMEEMRALWGRRQAPEMKDAVSEGDRAKAETTNQARTCERVGLLCPNKVLVAHLRHSLLSITATCHGVSGKQQCLEVRTGVSCHPGEHFAGTDGKDAWISRGRVTKKEGKKAGGRRRPTDMDGDSPVASCQ